MILSDHGFSSQQDSGKFFAVGNLQIKETGFHPKYDESPTCSADAIEEDVLEEEATPSDDAPDQKITDAYVQGYLHGQQAAMVQQDEIEQQKDALAEAIDRLKIVDESKLAKQLWEAVLSLFQEAVGNAKISKPLMQKRCEAAMEIISTNRGEACLHVAPDDVKLLQAYDCEIPIIATPELLPGSVHLVYASGEIMSGSIAVSDEIENRICHAGGDPC